MTGFGIEMIAAHRRGRRTATQDGRCVRRTRIDDEEFWQHHHFATLDEAEAPVAPDARTAQRRSLLVAPHGARGSCGVDERTPGARRTRYSPSWIFRARRTS